MVIGGIDIGLKGAISFLEINNKNISLIKSHPMPLVKIKGKTRIDESLFCNIIKNQYTLTKINYLVIEKQAVMAQQGLSSSGLLMEEFGFAKGLAQGLGIESVIIHSREWQSIIPKDILINSILENKNIKETKKKSISFCMSLFPEAQLITKRGRVLDGISDSILLPYYFLTRV